MRSKVELEQAITKITNKIYKEFPELSKYILEMPIDKSEKGGVNTKNLADYYQSLEGLVLQYSQTHKGTLATKKSVPGYSLYPPSEDIYIQGKKEDDVNLADLTKNKTPNEKQGSPNEKDFKEDMSGDDLDVPGSELDDQQESVGSEDEENNYYSLGGDKHNDLEEDNRE